MSDNGTAFECSTLEERLEREIQHRPGQRPMDVEQVCVSKMTCVPVCVCRRSSLSHAVRNTVRFRLTAQVAEYLNLMSMADEDMPQVVLEEHMTQYGLEDESKGEGIPAYKILYTG